MTVTVCAIVVEIATKRTFLQLVVLEACIVMLYPWKLVFKTFPSDQKGQQVFIVTSYLIYFSTFVSFKGDIGVSITVKTQEIMSMKPIETDSVSQPRFHAWF